MAAGNKGIEASVLPEHLYTCFRVAPKLEEGWAKLSSSWGEHITFPTGMYSLEKYIGLDNIITKEESFLVLTYNLSIAVWSIAWKISTF